MNIFPFNFASPLSTSLACVITVIAITLLNVKSVSSYDFPFVLFLRNPNSWLKGIQLFSYHVILCVSWSLYHRLVHKNLISHEHISFSCRLVVCLSMSCWRTLSPNSDHFVELQKRFLRDEYLATFCNYPCTGFYVIQIFGIGVQKLCFSFANSDSLLNP